MFLQGPAADGIVKIPGVQGIDGDAQPPLQVIQVHAAHIERLIAYQLRGHQVGDLVKELAAVTDFCHKILPRSHIRHRDSVAVPDVGHAHDVIIFRLVKGLRIHCGPRGDDAHHLPLDQPLCRGRVLHLLTDGHLVSFRHQAAQIAVHRVVRHAAHGRPLLQSAVLPCQSDLQLPGRGDGVVEKHLVKISQSIKQDAVAVLLLGLHVLLHHWG